MSQVSFTDVLEIIPQLSTEQKNKIRTLLDNPHVEKNILTNTGYSENNIVKRDYSAELQWVKEHRNEYDGQWVALKGTQLISHATNAKEVFAAAQAAGHSDALIKLIVKDDERILINLG